MAFFPVLIFLFPFSIGLKLGGMGWFIEPKPMMRGQIGNSPLAGLKIAFA
jgi:hypothetical protein